MPSQPVACLPTKSLRSLHEQVVAAPHECFKHASSTADWRVQVVDTSLTHINEVVAMQKKAGSVQTTISAEWGELILFAKSSEFGQARGYFS